MQPEEHQHQQYLAQTKLDEAVYALLELGWSDEDIHNKVEELVEAFEGGDEE